eukprot:10149122-Alexandrium_andersonii.AAC.1
MHLSLGASLWTAAPPDGQHLSQHGPRCAPAPFAWPGPSQSGAPSVRSLTAAACLARLSLYCTTHVT